MSTADLAASDGSLAALRELRRTRQLHRLGSLDWFEVAYRVYLFGILGGGAILLISDSVKDATVAGELIAAVGNALDNFEKHAGPDARAYVLVEDLGDAVTVSVRDDGVGIPDGRLAEAAAEGRLGIAKSIVGRMNWLGGRAELSTGAGAGTEWELTVPRTGGSGD